METDAQRPMSAGGNDPVGNEEEATMTRQVLFVQGGGEGTHDGWDNKLVASLINALGPGYFVRYPRMPNEAAPNYASWKAALEAEFASLEPGAILVGHSIGGTILINVLAEGASPRSPRGLFLLAAPFIGPRGWSAEDFEPRSDLAAGLPPQMPVFVYHGSGDETAPVDHADLYAEALPGAHIRRLTGRDHQLNNDLSEVARDMRHLA